MSASPFGPNQTNTDVNLLRSFQDLVTDVAVARLDVDYAGKAITGALDDHQDQAHQKLADASQRHFMLKEQLAAHAMVLVGSDVIRRAISLIQAQDVSAQQ